MWFKTTGHRDAAVVGRRADRRRADGPVHRLGAQGGCLEGSVGNVTVNAPIFGTCTSGTPVNDGKWHQAALTVEPRHADPLQGFSQTATLYLDGASVGTATDHHQATASATGYIANIGNGPNGDFNGSIADVSIYTSQLTATTVTGARQRAAEPDLGQDPQQRPARAAAVPDHAHGEHPDDHGHRPGRAKIASYMYADGALVQATACSAA